ncbi:ABC transporter substrate-binding protein [Microaerobacter geothermalis]|uniref:ABC transporter substrate-binding protein n=1 Tax=Microaerobacter geothermalis TaxID=674972 RepID=UPI001F3B6258|nr:ABC transporter substrate-binding protein [Microaerobacter geothermalis]MCF6095228.1 ABC transporter substrate-binding protein [Microaerobacter geothermalis]
MKKRINIVFALALSLVLVFSNFSAIRAAEQLDLLKVGITKDENTLTPYTYVTGSPGLDLVNLIYDTLFQLDENNQPQPWLVKDYEISEDGLTYTFKLHDDVKWHDGKPLTAEDVKFTYEYVLQYKKSRFTKPSQAIESIDVRDDTTLVMKLKQPEPDFMIQPLADLPILPKHIWSQITNPDEAKDTTGSGPYILEEYKPNQFYKFKANPDYFMGEPIAKSLVLPIIEDTTALFTALKAGEVDAVSSNVSPELVKQFESNPNIKLVNGAGYRTTLFQINAEKYPLSVKEVREAMAYAIDSKYLIDTVLLGYATEGNPGFIHPTSPYFNKDVSFKPDLDKAKLILENAGFKDTDNDGFREDPEGKKIELVTLVYSSSPTRIRTAEIITEWLNELGLKVSVKAMDMTTVDSLVWPDFDVAKGRDYDLAMWSWSSTMQLFPARLVELFHSDTSVGTVNIGGYKNEEFDQLADKLGKTIDPAERKKIIMDMQALVAEEFPVIPLYYEEVINAYNPNVSDQWVFQNGKGIINKFSFIHTEKSKTDADKQTGSSSTTTTNNETTQAGQPDAQTSEASSGKGTNSLLIFGFIILAAFLLIFWMKRSKNNSSKGA